MRRCSLSTWSVLLVVLAAPATGCACEGAPIAAGDVSADAARMDSAISDADAAPDAPPIDASLGECGEPFELHPDPGAEARAAAALAALDPAASITWSAVRGTLSIIGGLAIEVPDCPDDHDVYEDFLAALEASPDLFQIDRDEWQPDETFACSRVTEVTDFVRIRRIAYGPFAMRTDVFFAAVERREGVVTLFGFGGTYVPTPDAEIVATLEACPDRAEALIAPTLRARPFDFTYFLPPPADGCQPDGDAAYDAAADDTLTFETDTLLAWDETVPIRLRRLRNATLEVALANRTPRLLQSDAYCAIEDRLGWIRTFDAVTGEWLWDQRTPVPGCIVC